MGNITSVVFDSILFKELKTKWISTRKESSFCPFQDGEEIVKFLQDVLDALFAMFSTEDGNSTPHSGQVFHVLVSIISFLENPKFEHFRPVMDAYISGHFAAALVYK